MMKLEAIELIVAVCVPYAVVVTKMDVVTVRTEALRRLDTLLATDADVDAEATCGT